VPANPIGAFVVGAIGAFIFCLTTLPLALAGVVGLVIHGVITVAILVAGPILASRGEAENKPLLYGAATGAAIWIVSLILVVSAWDVD
jgi:hypothetical protein